MKDRNNVKSNMESDLDTVVKPSSDKERSDRELKNAAGFATSHKREYMPETGTPTRDSSRDDAGSIDKRQNEPLKNNDREGSRH